MRMFVSVVSSSEDRYTRIYSESAHPCSEYSIRDSRMRYLRHDTRTYDEYAIDSIISSAEPYCFEIETLILISGEEVCWAQIDTESYRTKSCHSDSFWHSSSEILLNSPSSYYYSNSEHDSSFDFSDYGFDFFTFFEYGYTRKITRSIRYKVNTIENEATGSCTDSSDEFSDSHTHISYSWHYESIFESRSFGGLIHCCREVSVYFLVATSQVRTSSSIKAPCSGWLFASLVDPQQARWCLRSSRLSDWRSPIVAFTWWAISAQYASCSMSSATFLSVHSALRMLVWSLDLYGVILIWQKYIEKPYDFDILDLLFSESTSRIRGILYAI